MSYSKKHIQHFFTLSRQAERSLMDSLAFFPNQPTLPATQPPQPQSHLNFSSQPLQSKEDQQPEELTQKMQQLSIFDSVPEFMFDESLQRQIANLKVGVSAPKVKQPLFRKYKREQEYYLSKNKPSREPINEPKDQSKNTNNININLDNSIMSNQSGLFTFTAEDMDKLRPQTDLNDTIVMFYIKLINFVFLPAHLQPTTYYISSFFMEKLLQKFAKQDFICDKDSNWLVTTIRPSVTGSYSSVIRWTRNANIFEKQLVVIPINAFRHWFCVIILRPYAILDLKGSIKCQLIYCDSMFEKKEFILTAIRRYLQLEIKDKKEIEVELDEFNVPSYQLLLPRQTNTHDCGLYLLIYIEELTVHPELLSNLAHIHNRRKLNLFPRTLLYTMRERIRKLIISLASSPNSEHRKILDAFRKEKQEIMEKAESSHYDTLNEREQMKYEKMCIGNITGGMSMQEKSFLCEIRFYLDPEINFYEKDK